MSKERNGSSARSNNVSEERHGRGQNLNPGFMLADGNLKSPPPQVSLPGSLEAVTFIGSLESQGAAAAVALEEEPHLVMGADNEVWDGRTCQAVGREILSGLHPAKCQGKAGRKSRSQACSGSLTL